MQVFFKPDKKPWEFWKRDRYLKHGEDFLVSHGRIVFNKPFKGKLEFKYDYRTI